MKKYFSTAIVIISHCSRVAVACTQTKFALERFDVNYLARAEMISIKSDC